MAGLAHEAGKASIIVVNKWDLIEKDGKTMDKMREEVRNGLAFMTYAPILFISAKTGQRVDRLFELIDYVSNQASTRITTGMLNSVLADAQTRVQPPSDKGRRLKIYYMTQVGIRPPHFVVFCNDSRLFHFSYQRYLEMLKVCKTKKTELLFLALFLRMLRIGGRCACIVPDGVLFGSSTAHKAIRKELVEGNRLEAVISMPSGVFKPYAGVSTAILVFTKTGHGGTDNVWFYDMQADGFSLDDKRSPVQDNDIPDIIARFRNIEGEKDRQRTEKSFFVPKTEIAENGYDLSINKYKKTEYIPVEYPPTSEIMAQLRKLEKQIGTAMDELDKMLQGEK